MATHISSIPNCSSGGKCLSSREGEMFRSYSRSINALCENIDCKRYHALKAKVKASKGKKIQIFATSGSLHKQTSRLLLTLATDRALYRAVEKNMRCPSGGWFGDPGRFPDAGRWRSPSPFYACRYLRKNIQHSKKHPLGLDGSESYHYPPGKIGWLARRRAEVHAVTFHHKDVLSESYSATSMVRSVMRRMDERVSAIQNTMLQEWLVGGYYGWDVEPMKRGGKEVLNFHIHMLVEPYRLGSNEYISPKVPRSVKSAWAKTAKNGESHSVKPDEIVSSRIEDTYDRLLYAAGLCKIGSSDLYSFYPKLMRGFDPGPKKKRSGSTSSHMKPTIYQLMLMHAAHVSQPDRWPRFFGGWEHTTKIGRAIRNTAGKRSCELQQNDPALKALAQ